MKKHLLKAIAIFVLLLGLIHACQDYSESLEEESSDQHSIENAKFWYEVNKPSTMNLRSSDNSHEMQMKPVWKYAFEQLDKQYVVVETDLMAKGRISYMDKQCYELYKETRNESYNQTLTRLVLRTDKATGETVGFLMSIVPDLDWLRESNFKPFKKMTYLKRNEKFSGQIIFHDLNGQFVNGWQYENGQVAGTISISEEKGNMALRSSTCQWEPYYSLVTYCTDWYTVREWGNEYGGTTCSAPYWEYQYSMMVCSSSGSGGYGGGSTGGGEVGNIASKVSLDDDGAARLNDKMKEMKQDCGYLAMYNEVTSWGAKFSDVVYNPTMSAPGSFNPSTWLLTFKDAGSIDEAFPEEFIHLFQGVTYPTGTAQYTGGKPGNVNIEFEAKLIQDILCCVGKRPCPYYGIGQNHVDEYFQWILDLTNNGQSIPDYNRLTERHFKSGYLNYWDFLNDFQFANPNYGTIKQTLNPDALARLSTTASCN